MYCPVYGSNSNYKNNTTRLGFFEFPSKKNDKEKSRRNVWIDFCKRKQFEPTHNTRICSRHFSDDSYLPSHSPTFLASIGYKSKVSLKRGCSSNGKQTCNLTDSALQPKKRPCRKLSRIKVSNFTHFTYIFFIT